MIVSENASKTVELYDEIIEKQSLHLFSVNDYRSTMTESTSVWMLRYRQNNYNDIAYVASREISLVMYAGI